MPHVTISMLNGQIVLKNGVTMFHTHPTFRVATTEPIIPTRHQLLTQTSTLVLVTAIMSHNDGRSAR